MKYTNEALAEAVKGNKSWAAVYRALTGKTGNSGAMESNFKRRSVKLGVDYSHFAMKRVAKITAPKVVEVAPVAPTADAAPVAAATVQPVATQVA